MAHYVALCTTILGFEFVFNQELQAAPKYEPMLVEPFSYWIQIYKSYLPLANRK